ncbi:hypothetical protein [Azospirillum himalayense]|uniref:Uncharacterized protein n=1 Tax=Azospirillum himalayense TaxID=654847 RepID=A0ABW0G3A8_9PROT
MALAPPWGDDIERAKIHAKPIKPEYRGDGPANASLAALSGRQKIVIAGNPFGLFVQGDRIRNCILLWKNL